MPIRVNKLIHLGFDINFPDTIPVFHLFYLYLIVEMTNVAHNSLVLHGSHVFGCDDVFITGCGYINITLFNGFFHGIDFKSFHGSLQGTYGVNLGNNNPGSIGFH